MPRAGRRVALRIEVDEQHAPLRRGEARREIDGGRRLADAALLVGDREDRESSARLAVSTHARGGAPRRAPGTASVTSLHARGQPRGKPRDLLVRMHALHRREHAAAARRCRALASTNVARSEKAREMTMSKRVVVGHDSTRAAATGRRCAAAARPPPAAGTRSSCGSSRAASTCQSRPRDRERNARAARAPLPTSSTRSRGRGNVRQRRRARRARDASTMRSGSRIAVRLYDAVPLREQREVARASCASTLRGQRRARAAPSRSASSRPRPLGHAASSCAAERRASDARAAARSPPA